MLFQSVQFLFLFLPLVWLGFVVLHLRAGLNTALTFLVAASAFFYAWHTPHYLLILRFRSASILRSEKGFPAVMAVCFWDAG
jgi:alginate O-acetyltransferase complex protein AlgI